MPAFGGRDGFVRLWDREGLLKVVDEPLMVGQRLLFFEKALDDRL